MLRHVPELKDFDRGDGVCMYLLDNNLCSIYEHRPLVCNVSEMYNAYFRQSMTPGEFINLNIEACQKLKSIM